MTTEGLDVRLTFATDWHVGTGSGRVGAVDACVHRDPDGLPFVPAKTLTGVWRDACETVAQVLDGAPHGPWSSWVNALFGGHENADHAPALLSVGPAHLPEDVAAAVRAYPALREALFVRRPGVEIDPATGTAREDSLRLEERATTGLTLKARVEALRLPPSVPFPVEAELLLRAGARLVDSLGGKRSRGAGRVILQVGPPPAADQPGDHDPRLAGLLDLPQILDNPGKPPKPYRPTADLANGVASPGRGRVVHRILLRVRTPVVVPQRLRGNLLTTYDRILGTGLLPAILERLPERLPERLGLDDIRVTDAVPALHADDRYLPAHPAPLVWQRPDKGEGMALLNVAVKGASPEDKAKPTRDRIARRADGSWSIVRPGTTERTHAVIDDEARRPLESAGGGLFTFEGIPADTVLVTDVVLPRGVGLGLSAGDKLRLGRSRKDDFGEVEVLAVDELPGVVPDMPSDASGLLTVWCLSDVLLRSSTLAPDPTPQGLASALATALGTELEVVEPSEDDDRRPTVTAATRRDGFAVRWGRPRPTLIALAAGSVVTLRVTGAPVTAEALARIERDGIGDRLPEGFGRVRFNLPDLAHERLVLHSDDPLAERARDDGRSREGQDPQIPDVLGTVLRTAWRTVIRRRVEELAASTDLLDRLLPDGPSPSSGPRRTKPTASQLGQLRAQLERRPEHVVSWFAGLRASSNRSRSWSDHAIDAAEILLLGELPPNGRTAAGKISSLWEHLTLHDADGVGSAGLPPESATAMRRELAGEACAALLVALHRQRRGASSPTPEAAR